MPTVKNKHLKREAIFSRLMNRRKEATICPRCGQKSSFPKCPHCKFQKWYNPSRNTHNKMCKCAKCRAKKEKKRAEKKPRVRGK